MQKHKADKYRKRRVRDKERQRTTQKHQTQRTTHKPTRQMGNLCRLRTAICHGNSRSVPSTYVEGFQNKDDVLHMPHCILGDTGLKVSKLSFGASSLGSVFRETDDTESQNVVHTALKTGINYLDTAPWYGHGKSETVLGKALQGVPRESYYVATKVGRYLPEVEKMFDFRAERTLQSVDESLQRLGLDSVDIIQVHDMEFAPSLDIIINETLPALQKVKDSGKAKFIGITGYPLQNFKTVLERSTVKIDSILTYCRACINDNSLQEYIPFLKERGVGIINASPVGMGLLTHRGPPAWHPALPVTKAACAEAAKYCEGQGVDISRLAMGYTLDNNDVHTTLFSTASLVNLKRNLDIVRNPLTQQEKTVLQHIITKYMEPLTNRHWEGVEVAHYWQQIKGNEPKEEFVLG
ncbi:hypothetical protein FSP39_022627 [Pinctada imbricata]|uniref:NADP-dependent oxidoreductase domain-containing protein n=1 Tax=Pinctada imbricata TaxID=66713 RepID=A0AA88YNB5_PINIB|nr:hypothetical protein FSP39_022627 [Pinctada imbricata]